MFIEKNKNGKRFVIPDIHGCLTTFQAPIKKINLNKNDQLFLLGDYIDRGKNSSGVIDYIIELQNSKYQIFPLKGNHEKNVLEIFENYEISEAYWFVKKINKSGDLLDENWRIKEKYYNFFQNLPLFYELDKFLLIHAGLNFKNENPFIDTTSMLEIRNFEVNVPPDFPKIIIHGHNPTNYDDILKAIKTKKKVIPLDNGCIYNKPHKMFDYTKLAKLLCLNIDNYELFEQKNID